mgnify:CR=1 FL=1
MAQAERPTVPHAGRELTDAGSSRPAWLMPVGVLLLLAALALLIFQFLPRQPGDGSPEAGFLRDMARHHSQAVEMALIIRDRTDDEQLRFMATDIMLTQQSEIGMMDGWLRLWDLPLAASEPPMAWMGHPEGERMASQEDVERLRTLPADEAEVLFLQLMARHHYGALDMAQAYLDRGDQEDVSAFAERVITIQRSEIDLINQMLQQRGEEPITGLESGHEEH